MVKASIEAQSLSDVIDSLSANWADVSLVVETQLAAVSKKSLADQNRLLTDLDSIFREARHEGTFVSIAWDLIEPLVDYIRRDDTSLAADQLLDLVVSKGNSKEVLLKLIEAVEKIEFSASATIDVEHRLQVKLLRAQEKTLMQLKTKRASRFLAEYTKIILNACKKCSNATDDNSLLRDYDAIVENSISHGAIHHLLSSTASDASEQRTMTSLMAGFASFMVELLCPPQYLPRSYLRFVEAHPRLALRLPTTLETSSSNLKGFESVLARYNEVIAEEKCATFWKCGSWARQELAEEELSSDTCNGSEEDDLDHGVVICSPVGAVLILAHNAHSDADRSLADHLRQERLLQISEMLMQLCARQNAQPVVLDACLYLASIYSDTSVFAGLEQKDPEMCLLHLQILSAISANTANPDLRLVAHYLVRDTLSLLTDEIKLQFYLGTLQECPIASLKSATVSMLKDQIASGRDFWRDEKRFHEINDLVLCSDEIETIEIDDALIAAWMQVTSYAILLMQDTLLMTFVKGALREWVCKVATRLAGHDFDVDELATDLLRMQLERVEELLS